MTQKHFIALAAAMLDRRPDPAQFHEARQQWAGDVRALAEVCQAANPAFKRDRFLDACGYKRV